MLADLGCRYVMVGHPEREREHGETMELVEHTFFDYAKVFGPQVKGKAADRTGWTLSAELVVDEKTGRMTLVASGVPADSGRLKCRARIASGPLRGATLRLSRAEG